MSFDAFFAEFLNRPRRTRRHRALRQALTRSDMRLVQPLRGPSCGEFQTRERIFWGSVPFINSKPQRRLAAQVEVPLSELAASSHKITGMVMGRLAADREDWTRVLRSRC
jgi:hypothetical protein